MNDIWGMNMWQKIQTKLDELSSRIGLKGLTLATEDGLLLASSGPLDGEWLAAICPLVRSNSKNKFQQQLELYREKKGIALEVFDSSLGEQAVFLCAAGSECQVSDPELRPFFEGLIRLIEAR